MKINLSEIRIDGGTQARAAINQAIVDEYAEAIRSGAKLPAVSLVFDGVAYWLVDGFHRYHAHRQAGKTGIDASATNGTQREAVLQSVGTNDTHGLRRTNEDKRKAVGILLTDPEWSKWSDRAVAEKCAVSHNFVGDIRRSLAESVSVIGLQIDQPRTVARNGTIYQQKPRQAEPEPEEKPRPETAVKAAPTPEPEEGRPSAVDLLDEINAENLLLQQRIEALTVTDQAKKIDELVRMNEHYRREKDVEMDKNALLQRRVNELERFRSQAVAATGAKDPRAALQWIKAQATRKAA